MKKNWKLIACGISVMAVLFVTACAADDEAMPLSFVEEETEEVNPSSTEEISQEEEQVPHTSTEMEVKEERQVPQTSTEMEVKEERQVPQTSTEIESQEEEQVSQISTEIEPQETETDDYLIFDNPFLLEDYYNTPEGKAAIEADFEDLAGEGMSVTISVIMDTINVIVKYEDSALLTEGIEETLAQQLESMSDRFWRQTIAYDEIITWRCVLRVFYVDSEGNVLAEQGYSAE